MNTIKVKPCPFCGATQRELDKKAGVGVYVYLSAIASDMTPWNHVVCLTCGSGSPTVGTWNSRKSTPRRRSTLDKP